MNESDRGISLGEGHTVNDPHESIVDTKTETEEGDKVNISEVPHVNHKLQGNNLKSVLIANDNLRV